MELLLGYSFDYEERPSFYHEENKEIVKETILTEKNLKKYSLRQCVKGKKLIYEEMI